MSEKITSTFSFEGSDDRSENVRLLSLELMKLFEYLNKKGIPMPILSHSVTLALVGMLMNTSCYKEGWQVHAREMLEAIICAVEDE